MTNPCRSLGGAALLLPIGFIENGFRESVPDGWERATHRLILADEWAPALDGIEQFSHLYVVFWLHQIFGPLSTHVYPEDRFDLPEVGILATRTPRRPNPIGLQVSELIARVGNVLHVRRLDALNGTPLLDVKPYLPDGDAIPDARVAPWVARLWEGRVREK